MSPGVIARQRLRSQHLDGPPFPASPSLCTGWGAMQSQEYGVAKWSVGQRATALTDAALERALADGTIRRTYLLRPTWHFVLPTDIRWAAKSRDVLDIAGVAGAVAGAAAMFTHNHRRPGGRALAPYGSGDGDDGRGTARPEPRHRGDGGAAGRGRPLRRAPAGARRTRRDVRPG